MSKALVFSGMLLLPWASPVQAQARDVSGLVADCRTDNAAALTALIDRVGAASAGGGQGVVALPGGCLAFASPIVLRSNVTIRGTPATRLVSTGATGAGFIGTHVSHVTIETLALDQQKSLHPRIAQAFDFAGSTEIGLAHITVSNATGSVRIHDQSADVRIDDLAVSDSLYHGVQVTDSANVVIQNCRMENEVGFGVILDGTTHDSLVKGCATTHNGIELVGATQGTSRNRIIGNHAERTGDNCFSMSGSDSRLTGNSGAGCAGNFIGVYGEGNTIASNTGTGNDRSPNGDWNACIRITPQFGGTGQLNVVTGNTCVSPAGAKGTLYGVYLAATKYKDCAPGRAYKAGDYCLSDDRIYRADAAGMAAQGHPTQASGAVVDGTVTWTFIRGLPRGNARAEGNRIAGNVVSGSFASAYRDDSGGENDIIAASGLGTGKKMAVPAMPSLAR